MEVHQITYFLAIVTERNFGRAAQRCGVSQPSVTRAIHKLERELGGPLLDRARGGVELTRLGRLVLPRLESIKHQLSNLGTEARSLAAERRPVVRLGVLTTIDADDVGRLVVGAVAGDPAVDIELRCGDAPQLAAEVRDGDLDLAFSTRPRETDENRLEFVPLYREEYDIATRGAAPGAGTGRAERGAVGHGALWREGTLGSRPPRITCERLDVTQTLLVALGGEAVIPRRCRLADGLGRHPLDAPHLARDIGLVLPRIKPHSPSIESLVSAAMGIDWDLITGAARSAG